MTGDYSLLEAMLMAAGGVEQSTSIFDGVDSDNLQGLVEAQSTLLSLRAGSAENWQQAISQDGEDRLSKAIQIEAWKNFQAGNATDADTLLKGMEILENARYIASDTLRWAVIAALTSVNRGVENCSILRGLEINNEDEMNIAINLISENNDSIIQDSILKGLAKSSDDLTLSVMRNSSAPLEIRKKAAKKLSTKEFGYRGRSARHLHSIGRCRRA